MNSKLFASAAFSVALCAQAQVAPRPAKPISHYMREIGLLYLENTKRMVELGLKNQDATPMLDPTNDASDVNSYGEILQEIEDRIRINISSAQDKQYLRLLQRTKAAAELTVLGDVPTLYSECYVQAHFTAIQGVDSGGNCTEGRYEASAKLLREAELKAAQADLARAKQRLADVENGVPDLTPTQKALCAKDVSFAFCEGTPEWEASQAEKNKQKTEELCAKGVFDKDYCAKFEVDHGPPEK